MKYVASQHLSEVSHSTLQKLKMYLDSSADKYLDWRAFVSVLPPGFYTSEDIDKIVQRGMSPTEELIQDLTSKNRTVGHLMSYLEKMEHFPALSLFRDREGLTIVEHPSDVDVTEGSCASYHCKATGFPPVRYQWLKMNVYTGGRWTEILSEGHSEFFKFKRCSHSDQAAYKCRLSLQGDDDALYTLPATLTIKPFKANFSSIVPYTTCAPVILKHPKTCIGNIGESCVLSCLAMGIPEVSYQWYRSTVPLAGENSASLEFNCLLASNHARYVCKVSNALGVAYTYQAEVIVNILPSGHALPDVPHVETLLPPNNIQLGLPVQLDCVAYGTGLLHYQWFKDGEAIPSYLDGKGKSLSIQKFTNESCGKYQCQVENVFCKKVLTNEIILNTTAPSTIASDKVALVIGNSNYGKLTDLKLATHECMSMETIRQMFAEKNSALNFILLDMCRREETSAHVCQSNTGKLTHDDGNVGRAQEHWQTLQQSESLPEHESEQLSKPIETTGSIWRDNIIMLHAACPGGIAYEVDGEWNSIFTKHLKKKMLSNLPVLSLCAETQDSIRADEHVAEYQIPQLQSVCKSSQQRCLRDPVLRDEFEEHAAERRLALWKEQHQLPFYPCKQSPSTSQCVVSSQEYGFQIHLRFQEHFTNVLIIWMSFIDCGTVEQCGATLEVQHETCSSHQSSNNLVVTVNNLQRLTAKLLAVLKVQFVVDGHCKETTYPLSFDRPLAGACQEVNF